MKINSKRIKMDWRISGQVFFIAVLLLFFSCSDKSKETDDTKDTGYDITADLEFSSGKKIAFKARSVMPSIDEPFVTNDAGETWMWTPAYQMEEEGIKYRMSLKALVKDEPANYDLYRREEDYLEVAGWYIELSVADKDGNTELYQSRYEGEESGVLAITSLSADTLEAAFSADIPRSPSNGDRLNIQNGKVKIKIKRVN